ncbi:peptidoglycan DD-metalloendopeptidase family protein [Motiliproteus sp.]|uniref:peptidoglycan DD-metalloendopeptidase family protein n=1 Tax=Motiliproteus sp. TaxID=1898955 RepID=UPI003BAB37E0
MTQNLRALLVPLLLLVLTACSGHVAPVSERSLNKQSPPPARHQSRSQPVAAKLPSSGYYRVQRGDTLYSIAWRYRIDFRNLAQANNIGSDYRIYPGQRLRLDTAAKANAPVIAASTKAAASSSRSNQPRAETKPAIKPSAAVRATAVPSGPVKWRWPASGRVIKGFSSRGSVNKGINLAGERGDPVYAAGGGVVVYAGSGLLGYGNLIIINHNETFLSAYAHNDKLLVQERQKVDVGQKIAEIGNSGADRTMLHFEIRKEGKPVDPVRYLPRR